MVNNKFRKAVEQRNILQTTEELEIKQLEFTDNDISKNHGTIETEREITFPTVIENEIKFNLADIIQREEKEGKNKTFYLEKKVSDEITKVAKKQKISESKLVNNILKHVLNVR